MKNKDNDIRVLALPGDMAALPAGVERVCGDVCDAGSMDAFFDTRPYAGAVLLHLAAVITIASRENPLVWRVNVEGTRNVMELALRNHINRAVYVSSVHAIPEKPMHERIAETALFSPETVQGQYAKSKAAAAEIVLEYAAMGLNVSIVHPSGIIGPGDTLLNNHLTRTVAAMASGRIPVSIPGGYDFVDVRDVARGILQCEEKGKPGECYILSGHYSSVRDLARIITGYTGRRFMPLLIPGFVLRWAAVLGERFSKVFRRKPLFTPYSLATLHSNALFSNSKARRELGYRPRPLRLTVQNVLHSLGFRAKVRTHA
jgi:dihydroflavonol-4-reductase